MSDEITLKLTKEEFFYLGSLLNYSSYNLSGESVDEVLNGSGGFKETSAEKVGQAVWNKIRPMAEAIGIEFVD